MKNKEEEKHKKEINTNSESENQEEEEEEEEGEGEEDKNKEEISPEDELKHADIITKYKNAGDIANKVLAYLVSQCLPGKYALDLCMEGDKMITDQGIKVCHKKIINQFFIKFPPYFQKEK